MSANTYTKKKTFTIYIGKIICYLHFGGFVCCSFQRTWTNASRGCREGTPASKTARPHRRSASCLAFYV